MTGADHVDIVNAIKAFQPTNDEWLELDRLVEKLFESGTAAQEIVVLLSVFERFPLEDGAGVFWTIVHGIESLDGYEPHLVKSVERCPSEFGVLMLGRILRNGTTHIEGIDINSLLSEISAKGIQPSISD